MLQAVFLRCVKAFYRILYLCVCNLRLLFFQFIEQILCITHLKNAPPSCMIVLYYEKGQPNMHKYLVLSDSHGKTDALEMIFEKENDCSGFIYLGDGIRDILFPSPYTFGKPVYSVRSMTDYAGSQRPLELTLSIDGIPVYLCHGDHLGTDVKLGFDSLLMKGIYNKASICFFGHTHRQTILTREGLLLFNPGAVKDGKYGILTTDNGKYQLEHRSIY